jgi:uncharacterized protein (DUF1499 family)
MRSEGWSDMQRSRLAVVCAFFGTLGVFAALLGPALIHVGALQPIGGFMVFGLGLVASLLGVLLAPFALYATRASARRAGRGLAWLGLACAALLLGGVLGTRLPGSDLPRINDITTDLADPPAFASDPAGMGRDMSYPAGFAAEVKRGYPDLAPIRTGAEPTPALARAEETARGLGWEVVSVDSAAGTLLARDTSKIFRFVDDVVVRVRPGESGGSIVDVRSKSRVGQGDIGANAARIRRFGEAFAR